MAAYPLDQPAEGRFDGREHRFPVRVYFEDTDLSGIVYHASYLRFMERARSDMLRAAGIDQCASFESGEGVYAVATLSIRYARPGEARRRARRLQSAHGLWRGNLPYSSTSHPRE